MTDVTPEIGDDAARKKRQRVGGALAPAGLSWALFEFARNPYYMLIVTYVFPPYFAVNMIGDPVMGQAAVSEATKWAGVIGALTAPVLGAMMDRGGARKPLMAVFLLMLVVSASSLWWATPGTVDAQGVFHPPAGGLGVVGTMSFLVLGFVGYTFSEMMHNAMLRSAGRPSSLSRISGAGLGLGQASSALALITLAAIGLAMPSLGTAAGGFVLQLSSGPLVAIWMLVFVIPFFIFMPDGAPEGGTWAAAARGLFSKDGKLNPLGAVGGAASYIVGLFKAFPETMKYLVACLIYKDGLIAMLSIGGVYTAGVLGWSFVEVILYGIWASICGAIGGLFLAGPLDRKFGVRRAIIIELIVMCAGVTTALGVTQDAIFYGLVPAGFAVHGLPIFSTLSDMFYLLLIGVIAAFATANISSSRYMIVVLAPKERIAEFFGLFALSSTATVWMGPLLAEVFTRTFNDQRIGFSPVLVLMIIGLAMMLTLKKTTGEKGQLVSSSQAHA
ncbi:MAG: MFS transporter [Hyphomonadaceae bacterium]